MPTDEVTAEQRGYDQAIAEVVAWLRGYDRDETNWPQFLARVIEAGEHKP